MPVLSIPRMRLLSRRGARYNADGMPQASAPLSPAESSALRIHLIASLLGGSTALLLGAYLLAIAMRLDLSSEARSGLIALIAWTLVVVAIPRHASYSLFLAFPLFGNHPGGALMEVLNLHLAATTLGLTLRAWRRRRPPPGGALWGWVLLVLFSTGLALLRSAPEAAVFAAQIDSVPSLVTQTLTSAETVPLYAVGGVIQLFLAVAWAYALCWAEADVAFVRDAMRYVTLGLFAVMVGGILDFHGFIDIRALLSRIDPHIDYMGWFQATFWNRSWFAWYFTMAFGLALGLLWLERPAVKHAVAMGLVVSYAYFLANGQRGGFLALHAVLLTAVMVRFSTRRPSWRVVALVAAVLLVPAVGVSLGLFEGSRWLPALQRLLEQGDRNRWTLWTVAVEMWQTSRLFGIGEAAFGWHYRDFIPIDSSRDIGAWGDAHSTWLQILATRGVIGLAAFLSLLVVLGKKILGITQTPGPARAIGLGLAYSLIAFLVYGTVQWMFYVQATQVFFWGTVALAAAVAPNEVTTPSSWRRRGFITAMLIALTAVQVAWSRPFYASAATEIARQPRGFYGPSGWGRQGALMRWSSRKGTLWLYPTGPVMTLQLRTTDPLAPARPVTVNLSIEDRLLDRFDLAREVVTRVLFLPESYRYRPPPTLPVFGERLPGRSALPLTVEVSRPWSPYRTGSLDGRYLGVAVFAPSFRALEPGEELGLLPTPRGEQVGVRWAAARCSLSVSLPSAEATLDLPLRPVGWDGTPVQLEAFWDDRAVALLTLEADRWHELRVEVAAAARRGVLTLQADRALRLDPTGLAVDLRYAALRLGNLSVEAKATRLDEVTNRGP